MEQLDDLWGDDEGTIDEGDDVEVWEMDQDGHWVEGDPDDGDEWESADEDEDDMMEDAVEGEDVGGEWSPSNDTVIPPPVATHDSGTPMVVAPAPVTLEGTSRPTSATGREHTPDVPKEAAGDEGDDADEGEGSAPWKRFEVLPSAPVDHAYYGTAPAQPSRSFMSRLAKEYKALQSSLPGAVVLFPVPVGCKC